MYLLLTVEDTEDILNPKGHLNENFISDLSVTESAIEKAFKSLKFCKSHVMCIIIYKLG